MEEGRMVFLGDVEGRGKRASAIRRKWRREGQNRELGTGKHWRLSLEVFT